MEIQIYVDEKHVIKFIWPYSLAFSTGSLKKYINILTCILIAWDKFILQAIDHIPNDITK